VAGADALEAAGKIPLAMGQQGWQQGGAFNVMMASLLPSDVFVGVYGDKNAEIAAGEDVASVFQAAAQARDMSAKSTVQNWNDATNLVITGKAGGQIMGDWAQGEFAIAEAVAGEDYSCLAGLGANPRLSTGGDAFYFPVLTDDAQIAAQAELAALLLKPETQVAFNLKKGSLPVRGDIDLSTANDCMKKGLALLADGALLPDVNMLITPDTNDQVSTLFTEFFADPSISAEDAQANFVSIIENAE
ncbi:MAG: carbohydrate ABC transporter substrate-binding protein, partial [Roseibium sp.]